MDRIKARCLEDFLGRWRLEREITDALGPPARFEGFAEWRPEGGADARSEDAPLLCVETGQLEVSGQGRFAAERRYLWAPDLSVFFADGRFFHQVPPVGGPAEHWCDPDHYRVLYDFSDWPRFRTTWEVSGPRKSYRMVSDYRRV
ncbi:DUF6314 family protein [Marinibacterium profundimaris]|uniref:Trigger factor n=1 Tax=Marinibacterium profundimaris TaxID=1679460 RepID=A0A225NQM5_9RHOB|nr:DUF6314 family protein [Marinibacterium profundimaris]OWU77261.1 trigger factor [Marinibacterium profundimaris]